MLSLATALLVAAGAPCTLTLAYDGLNSGGFGLELPIILSGKLKTNTRIETDKWLPDDIAPAAAAQVIRMRSRMFCESAISFAISCPAGTSSLKRTAWNVYIVEITLGGRTRRGYALADTVVRFLRSADRRGMDVGSRRSLSRAIQRVTEERGVSRKQTTGARGR